MRIPGIGNIKKLSQPRMMAKAEKMLRKAGIKKPVYVIKAEYRNYCETDKPSARNKMGFLQGINLIADRGAKEWIEQERTRLDKIIEKEEAVKHAKA